MNGWHFTEDGYVCGKCRDKLNIEGFAVENRIGRKACGLCECNYDDLHLISYRVVNAAIAAATKEG
jgi:hypothetical protein